MRQPFKTNRERQRGFTILEMLVATVVLVIGIVGVAKLVPVAINLDAANRKDSTALVIAQREVNALLDQPLGNATFSDPQGIVCPAASTCDLGNPAQPLVVVGSPVIMFGDRPLINYSQAQVAGYSFNYTDPDNPTHASYDVRWAVITFANAQGIPFAKRFIVGVRRQGGNSPFLPITLDTMVEK